MKVRDANMDDSEVTLLVEKVSNLILDKRPRRVLRIICRSDLDNVVCEVCT
jgi:hypothetical protein